MWFQDDLIDHKIDLHDKNQFEMKLDYSVHPDRRRNRYRIDTYFFIPKSLNVNRYSYTRDQFYADTQAYIRFKTPRQTFRSLLDPKNERSPLSRIQSLTLRFQRNPRDQRASERVIYELRMLGSMIRSEMRLQTYTTTQKIEKAGAARGRNTVDLEDARALWQRLLSDIDGVTAALRGVRPMVLAASFPAEVIEAYEYVDEFVCLTLETFLTEIMANVGANPACREGLREPYERTRRRIAAERVHRDEAGYPSVLRPDGPNESYVYRRGVLKKFVTGVLFLNMRIEAEGKRLAQAVAAIAAGVAMFIAIVATIATQRHYALDSVAFVSLAVLTYMIKDRVKDWIRVYFFNKFGGTLADHRVRIFDPDTNNVIGDCRESMTFVHHNAVPREVLKLRNRSGLGVIESEGKPETIISYRKEITIYTKRVLGEEKRVSDINDIIRFNITQFLHHMDDPIVPVHYYDTEHDAVTEVACAKVYHVNTIFSFVTEAEEGAVSMHRLRVVLDKNGIRDLQLMT